MPCCGRSPPLVAHRLPRSGERVPGRARVHCALSRGLRALPLALQVCRIRTSSRTSGRRAASSRRPVVSVPRVATRRERPALPLLCLCCSCASPVRVSNEIFLVQKSSLNYSDAKGTKGDLRLRSRWLPPLVHALSELNLVEAPDHALPPNPSEPDGRVAARLIQCSRHAGLAVGTDGARCWPRRAKDDAAADGAPKRRRACHPARHVTRDCAWQSDRRVVVTGMGIVSCLGNSQEEVAESLQAAKAGIKFNEKYKEIGSPAVLTGTGRAARGTRAGHQRASVRARGAGQRAPGPPHAVRMPHACRPPENCTCW